MWCWSVCLNCVEKCCLNSNFYTAMSQKRRFLWKSMITKVLYMMLMNHLSRLTTKPIKWHVHPAKTQISLGIHPVWSESSLCAQWVAKHPSFLHADSEDSDQTGPMPRLIWVFAGRTLHFVGFVMRWLMLDESLVKRLKCFFGLFFNWATTRQNVSSGVSDQVRLKLACAATEPS